jgi:RNA polymerase sigma-70 factor (ECF subfamily)
MDAKYMSTPTLPFPVTGPAPAAESAGEAFEREALPLLRPLYSTAVRLSRNAADAEDLVQETYLRAYRAFAGYERGTNIRAWLHTILNRAWLDTLRRRGRQPRTFEAIEVTPRGRGLRQAKAG